MIWLLNERFLMKYWFFDFDSFVMVEININSEKCKGCGYCVIVCPKKNIRLSSKLNKKGYHYAEIISEKNCSGCGMCFQMCPDLCIEIKNEKDNER